MGFFPVYCDKCCLPFEDLDLLLLKEIYGENIPKELKKIYKSDNLAKGFFIRNNVKYHIENYDSYGRFEVPKYEYLSKPSTNLKLDIKTNEYGDRLNVIKFKGYEIPHSLIHQKCYDIFVNHRHIALRLREQQLDVEGYLKIVFPTSSSDRNKRIQSLCKIYNPETKRLQDKDFEYKEKEKKSREGYVLNPASYRFVSKTGKTGKLILEKSEKISDLIPQTN